MTDLITSLESETEADWQNAKLESILSLSAEDNGATDEVQNEEVTRCSIRSHHSSSTP